MQKVKAILIVLFFLLSAAPGMISGSVPLSAISQNKHNQTTVYICDSERSVAFHSSKSCRGLNNCKHEILTVTKSDAVNAYGRRACKICY